MLKRKSPRSYVHNRFFTHQIQIFAEKLKRFLITKTLGWLVKEFIVFHWNNLCWNKKYEKASEGNIYWRELNVFVEKKNKLEWAKKSYGHDRNSFGKVLVTPFKKYIHYGGIFCENRKTQIFSNIKHLTNGRNFDLKNDLQKRIFENTKRLFFVLCDQSGI